MGALSQIFLINNSCTIEEVKEKLFNLVMIFDINIIQVSIADTLDCESLPFKVNYRYFCSF